MDAEENTPKEKKGNIFSIILAFLFGKKSKSLYARELKALNRFMTKQGYPYYNYRSQSVNPQFATFIFNIYTVVAPYREFFLEINDDDYIEKSVINFLNTDRDRELAALVEPENIEKLAEKLSYNELSDGLRRAYNELKSSYTRDRVTKINELNRETYLFKSFCLFDYYALLKFFDEDLKENTFKENPVFTSVSAELVSDQIVDLFVLTFQLMSIKNWKGIFDFLEIFPGYEKIKDGKITSIVEMLRDFIDKNVIIDFTRLVTGNYRYQYNIVPFVKDISAPYIDGILDDMNSRLETIKYQKKMDFIKQHTELLFGVAVVPYLKKYNPEESEKFESKGFLGYKYTEPAKYLNAYFKNYLENSIYKFMELLSARGKPYDVDSFTKLKVVYNDLNEQMQELMLFDKNLDSNVSAGYKLSFYLTQLANNQDVTNMLAVELDKVNKRAEEILKNSLSFTIAFRSELEKYLNDRISDKNELLLNWDDLEHALGKNISEVLVPIITSLNEISNLLEIFKS